MQDLCPDYGARWRPLDLHYLCLWREVLSPLPSELYRDLLQFMHWIVRHRYFQLLLASHCVCTTN